MVLEQKEKKESTTFNINSKNNYKKYGWKNIAVKIKENDLVLLNRQLDRLGYETLGVAGALAGRAKTTSAQHYVLHDLKSFTDKYVKSWSNFQINI